MGRAGALWIAVVASGLLPGLGCGGPSGRARSTTSGGTSGDGVSEDGISSGAPAAELPLVSIPLFDDMREWGREVEYEQICGETPCPTLEEVLVSNTRCSDPSLGPPLLGPSHPQIVTGCGLIQVHLPLSLTYWYEGFGSPPVAAIEWRVGQGDQADYIWGTTRSLACARSEQVICSICDDGYPACGEPSNWLPELPELPAGCSCEPDGEGGAQVSLDCFCSFYGCPSYSDLVRDCKRGDGLQTTRQAHSGCGQTSFGSDFDYYYGNRYHHSYDAVTGQLITAQFSLDAPVAWPCFTSRITGGSAAACATSVECGCNAPAPEETLTRCDDQSWFQTLVGSVPDER